jgi:hypothetical protein
MISADIHRWGVNKMQETEFSPKGKIGLVLGVLLIFSLIFAFVGSKASDQESEKMAAFASDGAVTTGKVTDMYIHVVAKVWVYWIDVEFKTQSGATQKGSVNLANSLYDRLKIGSPIQVTYVKSNPDWFFVPGTEPTSRSIEQSEGMSKFGLIASVVFGVGLLGLPFWPSGDGNTPPSRSTGESAGSTVILPTPKQASLRPASPSRQVRTSFGTRQYRG